MVAFLSKAGRGFRKLPTSRGRLERSRVHYLSLAVDGIGESCKGTCYTNGRDRLCTECYEKFLPARERRPAKFSTLHRYRCFPRRAEKRQLHHLCRYLLPHGFNGDFHLQLVPRL